MNSRYAYVLCLGLASFGLAGCERSPRGDIGERNPEFERRDKVNEVQRDGAERSVEIDRERDLDGKIETNSG